MKESKSSKLDLMTTDEVADLLAVSKRTIARWVDDMGLPAFRLGGVWRYDRARVMEWLNQFDSTRGDDDSEE